MTTPPRPTLPGAWLLLLLLSAGSIGAHQIRTGYIAIDCDRDSLRTTVTLDVADLAPVLGLDANGDGEVTAEEITAGLDRVNTFIVDRIDVRIGAETVPLRRGRVGFSVDTGGHILLRSVFRAPPGRPTGLAFRVFEEFGGDYKVLVRLTDGLETREDLLAAGLSHAEFPPAREGRRAPPRGFLRFLGLGIEHIWIGIDHVLFLLALIVVGGTFVNLVKIVTSFTVAHSVTLALATLGLVNPPARWVESGIALTIVYVALENFVITKTDRRWVITGCFGLIHGFGFASVLRELGLPKQGLAASLLAFNAGVEIGQVGIVALMWPIVFALSRAAKRRGIVLALSAFIATVGLLWLLRRAFGLELGLNAAIARATGIDLGLP